jgi:arginyl-tRNA synthetase
MLQVGGNQQIVFDFAQALSFDGRSAPYLQYAYARAGKLVAGGVGATATAAHDGGGEERVAAPASPASELHPSETALARLLSQFPETCQNAAERYEPAHLCNYLYACADAFSAFYRDCRVLGAPEPEHSFRLSLTRAFRAVLRTGFRILALPLPETM